MIYFLKPEQLYLVLISMVVNLRRCDVMLDGEITCGFQSYKNQLTIDL